MEDDQTPVEAVTADTDKICQTAMVSGLTADLGGSDLAQVRHLEKTGAWTRRERLRILWYRLRLTVQEMNYAARRVVELQMRLP
jgi:hypothetical protein